MNDYHQQKLRAMLEAKRAWDAAWQGQQQARTAYLDAQDAFLGCYSESNPPGPIICGTTFIKLVNGHRRADVDTKFEYTEADRVPTSE